MTSRRGFLASVAALAPAQAKPSQEPRAIVATGVCACGAALMYVSDAEHRRFLTCTALACVLYGRYFEPPTVALTREVFPAGRLW